MQPNAYDNGYGYGYGYGIALAVPAAQREASPQLARSPPNRPNCFAAAPRWRLANVGPRNANQMKQGCSHGRFGQPRPRATKARRPSWPTFTRRNRRRPIGSA